MSTKQLNIAFSDEEIKGNVKLLMIALADYAGDNGVCYPSWNTLMKKTSMSRGSVSKWLNVLEEKGKLVRVKRKRKSGANSSNKYLIYSHENFNSLDEEDVLTFTNFINHSSQNELLASSQNELQGEPSLINHHSKASQDEASVFFEAIWKEYTLGFLTKTKKRRGGNKTTAKSKFKKLLNTFDIKDIKALIVNEYRLDYNRDLERVFSVESMSQFMEDRVA